jgi:hypothetical protein
MVSANSLTPAEMTRIWPEAFQDRAHLLAGPGGVGHVLAHLPDGHTRAAGNTAEGTQVLGGVANHVRQHTLGAVSGFTDLVDPLPGGPGVDRHRGVRHRLDRGDGVVTLLSQFVHAVGVDINGDRLVVEFLDGLVGGLGGLVELVDLFDGVRRVSVDDDPGLDVTHPTASSSASSIVSVSVLGMVAHTLSNPLRPLNPGCLRRALPDFVRPRPMKCGLAPPVANAHRPGGSRSIVAP